MKAIIRIIQRAALGFEIWAIEQHIEDLQRVMRETNNLNHYRSAMIEIHAARTDLASARSRRDSLLPVGVRNTTGQRDGRRRLAVLAATWTTRTTEQRTTEQ